MPKTKVIKLIKNNLKYLREINLSTDEIPVEMESAQKAIIAAYESYSMLERKYSVESIYSKNLIVAGNEVYCAN